MSGKAYRGLYFAMSVIPFISDNSPALAQSNTEVEASSTAPSPSTARLTQNGVADIVVTAQRRSENLQKVPISISAFDAKSLQARNVTSTGDLMQVTPGVQIGSASIQRNELYIRGIGSNRFDAGGESSSGLFVDDVYQPRFSNLLIDLLDVQRVEVLKGPQGTLYGRNTIGGAVAIYTPIPDQTFHLFARADAGNKDLYAGQFSVSGPLSEKISFGLSAGYRHRDGFMKDTVSGNTNGGESYGGRAKLVFKPDERWRFILTGGAFKTKQDAIVFYRPTPNIFFGRPGLTVPPSEDRYDTAYNSPTGATSRLYEISGRLDYEGDNATLTSITAYQNTRDFTLDDQDTSTADSFGYSQVGVSKAFSQELRLSSSSDGNLSFGGKLKWVGGLYYYQETGGELTDFRLGPDSVSVFLAEAAGIPVPGNAAVNETGKNLTVKSYAAFGQATFAITDRLNLTAGARYTRDQKHFDIFGSTTLPGFPLVTGDFTTITGKTWGKFTPKVAVDYSLAKDVLFYASYAKGYKSGAPQAAVFNAVLAARLVDPETVGTFEVGAKTQFFDRHLRFNVAAYRSKFNNLQVRRFVSIDGSPVQPVLDNAASSTIKGVEVDATVVPIRDLTIELGYNYLDATYGSFVPQPGVDYSGDRLPRAPKNTLSANIRYEIPLDNKAKLALGLQNFYSSRVYFQPDNLPSQSQKAYSTTDINLGYTFPDGRMQISVWTKNVFGKQYLTYVEPQTPAVREIWSDKRTIGATLSFRE